MKYIHIQNKNKTLCRFVLDPIFGKVCFNLCNVLNYFTSFCLYWTPTLRLKMTTTDQAFQWCRFKFCFYDFHQCGKCGVCPENVGKMAFFECSEFQCNKFTSILLLELKRYGAKVRVFWNAGAVGSQMVGSKK